MDTASAGNAAAGAAAGGCGVVNSSKRKLFDSAGVMVDLTGVPEDAVAASSGPVKKMEEKENLAVAASASNTNAAVASAGAPSVRVEKFKQLATQRLFQPTSHQNNAEMISLCEELGLDSSDVVSSEAMLSCMDPSYLQRLAACLKVGPQGLFKQAFLA